MSYTNYTDEQLKSLGYIIHVTKVDFVLRPASPNINLIQGDEQLAIIKIKLLERNNPFEFKDGDSYNFKMGKIDHTFVWNDAFGINKTDHAVYVKVTNQMCTIAGRMLATIKIRRPTEETFSEYSDQSRYSIGDHVLHNNETYECIIPVEEPEEFDPEKWRKLMYQAHSSLLLLNVQKDPVGAKDTPSETEIDVVTELVERAETAANNAEIAEDGAEQALEDFRHDLEEIEWFDKIVTNSEIDELFT